MGAWDLRYQNAWLYVWKLSARLNQQRLHEKQKRWLQLGEHERRLCVCVCVFVFVFLSLVADGCSYYSNLANRFRDHESIREDDGETEWVEEWKCARDHFTVSEKWRVRRRKSAPHERKLMTEQCVRVKHFMRDSKPAITYGEKLRKWSWANETLRDYVISLCKKSGRLYLCLSVQDTLAGWCKQLRWAARDCVWDL